MINVVRRARTWTRGGSFRQEHLQDRRSVFLLDRDAEPLAHELCAARVVGAFCYSAPDFLAQLQGWRTQGSYRFHCYQGKSVVARPGTFEAFERFFTSTGSAADSAAIYERRRCNRASVSGKEKSKPRQNTSLKTTSQAWRHLGACCHLGGAYRAQAQRGPWLSITRMAQKLYHS